MALMLVLAVVTLVSLWWLLLRRRPQHAIDQLPGPPTVPVFGNVFWFATTREKMFAAFNEFAVKHWPMYRTWLVNIPVIHPLDPSYVEAVLSSSQHISKSQEYEVLSNWLGEGLLTSNGSKWHKRRKMLTPAFHFKILEDFVIVFNEKGKILISKLRAHQNLPGGVDIVPLVTHCALDVICETAMGTAINAQDDSESEYVSAMYEINDLMIYRMMRPWFYPSWIFSLMPSGRRHDKLVKLLHNFTYKVIRERRDALKKAKKDDVSSDTRSDDGDTFGSKKKFAFLDLLLRVSEEGEGALTDEDIREEVDTFMFEGHDTTAMAMSWTLYFLGTYPEVQSRCVEELRDIFSGSDRAPSMADLGAMKYLERVIKETLRLRPSVPYMGRRLYQPLKIGKYEFPADTRINIHIYSIHRNPEIFPDPERFDPDRFLPENCVGRHPYAFIPFSAGPRNCIGQKFAMLEMKSLMSTVLRNFKLESLDPEKHSQAVPDLILRPKHGLQIRVFPRDMQL